MSRRAPLPDGLRVRATKCATCIYHPASGFDIADLEAQIADPRMAGHFRGYRICHEAGPTRDKVCCRGFWNRHKDHFDLGQLAQRLKWVVFVTVADRITTRKARHGR